MKRKMEHNRNDVTILAGIASFTIIVVALIWFLSNASARGGGGTTEQDSMHSGGGGALSTAALEAMVEKPAPDFSITDRDGNIYSKESLKGKKVVLFFNEGLMCYPACWDQIAELASDSKLNAIDTVVLSVVVDPARDWQRAIQKMPSLAKATVAFDTDKKVSNKFSMLTTPSSMHYGSLPGHSYVIMDREGVVKHVYDDPNMAIHNSQLADELAKIN